MPYVNCPGIFAFMLAWDQKCCTKCAFGDLGGHGLRVLAARRGAPVLPKAPDTPMLRFPPQLASVRATEMGRDCFICSVYFANEPFGSFTDAAGPGCTLCPTAGPDAPHAGTQSRCHWLL